MSEEDKPVASGQPDPRFKPPQQKDEEKKEKSHTEKLKREGRGFIEPVITDYRFWIAVVSFILGFVAGRL